MRTINLPKSKVLSYSNLGHIVACTTKVKDSKIKLDMSEKIDYVVKIT